MKRIIIIFIILLMITVVIFIGCIKLKPQKINNPDKEIEHIITEFVRKNKSIKNCVVSVAKGDGSFSWSGASGTATQLNKISMTKNTPIYIASITKLYTATAIMKLYETGVLSLNDPISKYLPEKLIQGIHVYKGKDYSYEITIEELLSHTSGIADYYTKKPKDGKSLFEMMLEEPEHSWSVDDTIKRARDDLKPNFIPGTDASYSDTNFQLLGKIIESITGKPLYAVYEEFFFIPLGLKHTWLSSHPASGIDLSILPADVFYKDVNITNTRLNSSHWADGGIISTAEEMIIFLKALNEGQLIKKNTLKLMHNWHKLKQFPLQYGYGTMYFKLPKCMNIMMKIPALYGHSGSTGSFLYYNEDQDIYIAGSINQVKSKLKPFILIKKIIKAVK